MMLNNNYFYFNFSIFFPEADRDILDWSGRKAMDYRKQSTTVSASTYSSKYGSTMSLAMALTSTSTIPLINVLPSDSNAFGTIKLKRHKRYSTASGVLNRTQSMLTKSNSPESMYVIPKRTTYYSPELDHGKRTQKRYRSILFRKKSYPPPKDNFDDDS